MKLIIDSQNTIVGIGEETRLSKSFIFLRSNKLWYGYFQEGNTICDVGSIPKGTEVHKNSYDSITNTFGLAGTSLPPEIEQPTSRTLVDRIKEAFKWIRNS